MQQMREDNLGELEGVSIVAKQQSIYYGVVSLGKGMGTSAAGLERERREFVRFLRSVSTLLMKLVML